MMPPDRILLQQHHKNGVRRPKRVVPERPRVVRPPCGPAAGFVPASHIRHIRPWINHMGQEIKFENVKTKPKKDGFGLGNLLWVDYRFFIGAKEPAAQYSRCRACRAILIGHAERKAHMEKYKCTLWLSESYRVLNLLPNALVRVAAISKRECVSCGAVTDKTLWGVPLCDKRDTCVDNWMFDDEMPCANLTAALVQVKEVLKTTLEGAGKLREANSK